MILPFSFSVVYCPLPDMYGVSNNYAEIGCVMHILLMGLGEIQGTSIKAILLLMLKIYVTKTSATCYEGGPFLSLLVCSYCQPCSSLKYCRQQEQGFMGNCC